jgi:hypothetical protein
MRIENMSLTHAFTIVQTRGFITDIPDEVKASILEFGLKNISKKTDLLVFKPEQVETREEDEGRTLVIHIDHLTKKCYAKLDDFGEPTQWEQTYEPEIVEELRKAPNSRFVITFMLAEEY